LSIEYPSHKGATNQVDLLSGAGNKDYDYYFTRLLTKWLGNEIIKITGKDYVSISKTENILI
jgi:hypothetical protein